MKNNQIAMLVMILFCSIATTFAHKTLNLSVKGMHCGSCESKFKSLASTLQGVTEVNSVSAQASTATIIYDEKATSEEALINTLAQKSGYNIDAVNSVTAVSGKPAGCCKSGKSTSSCKKSESTKTKCSSSKED